MNAFAGIRPNFPRGVKPDPPSFFPWRLQWGLSIFQWGSNPHNPPANFYPDPYPIRIRGIVENDIRIHPYPQKFTDIRKYLSAVPYPRFRAVRTSATNKHLNRTGTGNNTPITQKYDLLACFLL